jgi:hypothetical protein
MVWPLQPPRTLVPRPPASSRLDPVLASIVIPYSEEDSFTATPRFGEYVCPRDGCTLRPADGLARKVRTATLKCSRCGLVWLHPDMPGFARDQFVRGLMEDTIR